MIDSSEPFERLTIQDVISTGTEQAVAELGISIVTTRNGTTGEQRWFLCSGKECGRRCSTLYLAQEGLVCSACAGLPDEKPQQQPRARPRQQPTDRDTHAMWIERNDVPNPRPDSTAETQQTVTATRKRQPPRQLVEEFRRVAVNQVLARFGPPVSIDNGAGLHVCRVSQTKRFVMLSTSQRLGGVRWWFRCDACQERCGFLYLPRSARGWDLRCRKCWNLTYLSQRR